MCTPLAIAGATAASGLTQAYGQYQEGVANSKYYQYQADQARQEGKIAIERGQRQSELIQDTAKAEGKNLKTSQAEYNASQKVALAASGMSGTTAENIALDSMNKQQMDEAVLRYNYDTKSYEVTEGAKYQKYASDVAADQYGYASKNAKRAGKMAAFNTLLGTAASVAAIGALGAGGAKSGLKTGVKTKGGFSGINRVPSLSF